jgi:aspartate carbamoyltransferase catalytic subunit
MPIDLVNGERTAEGHPFAAIRTETSVERAIEGADAVMVLRIQSERQRGGFLPSLREYSRMYGINAKRMELAKPEALVMHPGPMNEGVEIDSEVAHGPRSVIEEQVANGVAVRMALMFGIITPALVPARSRN